MNRKPFEDIGNFTTFPNDVLDYIMPNCKPSTWKVLCATIRKTIGWHKPADMISLSQYHDLTGIAGRKNLINAIQDALEKGFLVRAMAGKLATDGFIYALNRDFVIPEEWQTPSNETVQGSYETEQGVVTKQHNPSYETEQGVVTKQHIQNKGLNKDLNKGLKDDLRPVTPYDVWEGIVGTISRHDFDKISRMIEDWKEHRTQLDSKSPDFQYWPDEIVIKAMRTMMNQPNPPDRPNLNYVEKIIQSWMKEGTEPKTKERVQKVRTATTTKAPEYDEDYRVELV